MKMRRQNTSTDVGPTQTLVLPQVRYHPSIQTAAGQGWTGACRDHMKMRKQNTIKDAGPPQNPVLPQVRYHPSIQNPAGGTNPRASKTQRTSNKKATQGNQDANRTVRPQPVDGGQKPVQKPPATDPDPPQKPQTTSVAAARPEEVPLGVGVQMEKDTVEQVEVLTRGQRDNPDWFAWRKNRITASVAHSIAHSHFVNGKSNIPPPSYLSAITGEGPRVQTRAMSWGVQMEAEAVRRYQKFKSSALGRPISVQDCGLFIDPQRSWLAASPDGIVEDSRTGQQLLCLEVKCPYKHRQRTVEEACRSDTAFCLTMENKDRRQPGQQRPVYHLKTSHSYFTQVQVQLAVTGLRQADFVVFTLKDMAVVPVSFDAELWEETVSKLETFYKDAVVPHLRQKNAAAAAAGRTEL
ncbi:uncharacterized protein KZ484_023255 [Pholidichthys leucotaenia]